VRLRQTAYHRRGDTYGSMDWNWEGCATWLLHVDGGAPCRYLLTATTMQTDSARTYVELALKIGTALLITCAATLVLVHASVYFGRLVIIQD
jgi:hypothetical protein